MRDKGPPSMRALTRVASMGITCANRLTQATRKPLMRMWGLPQLGKQSCRIRLHRTVLLGRRPARPFHWP